ncbi:MAG: hypothetical protein ACW98F_11540 [Candidatus Hodarchaeales archaeon]|jgi:hypothetical protein
MPISSYSEKRWGRFWMARRDGETVSQIAKTNEVSTQAVYKALNSKNSKVETFLLSTAKSNRIRVYQHSNVEGFLWGYSPAFKADVYITYSPKTGTQVWHEHKGDCRNCDALSECLWLLKTEAEERNITIPRKYESPTEIALFIFETLKRKLRWNDSVRKYSKKASSSPLP